MRALFLLLLLCCCSGLRAQGTTVILLRHAERSSKYASAELSRAGQHRAQGLVEELAALRPTALFASHLRRAQQTLEPLAGRLGLPLQVYPRGQERALVRRLLLLHEGETVVVCGHSDTLAILAAALGCESTLPEIRSFDRYWVVRVAAPGPVSLEERRQSPVPH